MLACKVKLNYVNDNGSFCFNDSSKIDYANNVLLMLQLFHLLYIIQYCQLLFDLYDHFMISCANFLIFL